MNRLDILVVDDQPYQGIAMRRIVGTTFEVVPVTTIAAARSLLYRQPRVCFVDMYLPDGMGVGLVAEIRSTIPDAYIIAVTAVSDDDDDLRKALAVGADEAIAKPLHLEDLVAMIRQRLQGPTEEARKPEAGQSPAT